MRVVIVERPEIGPHVAGRRLSQDEEFRRFAAEALPGLLKGAYLLVGDVDLAEDAVQGTLLRVFKNWHHAREAPGPYSRAVLVSVCRDHWRYKRRRPREILTGGAVNEPHATAFSDAFDQRDALAQALRELPRVQREILVLRFYLDLPVTDTARLLELPEGTVKSNTSRGLERLRGLLSPPAGEVNAC
ncbi:MAG: SigE family RNA polymerase sigma factor [Solirubrobacteraceae bacterium]|jgi:RNA polymerase sigma-70 factor (sigma-E family)